MPLSITVGLSRKVSRNFQSTGASINVTAELDSSLLARPEELQQQIGQLYLRAETSLHEQMHAMDTAALAPRLNGHDRVNPRDVASDTSGGGSDGAHSQDSAATPNQHRAIAAMAQRLGIDPVSESRDVLGVELEGLRLRQASKLIDHLARLQNSARSGDDR